MTVQQLDVIQGSDEWVEARQKFQTASEAPTIMGANPNCKRNELLEAKATKTPIEFSTFVEEVIFADGHKYEAMARPILEGIIGEDLYPVTCTNGQFLASYDGLPMMEQFIFEHKQWNAKLGEMTRVNDLPPGTYWQLEHQLMVCPSAEYVLFVVSDGTEEKWVSCQYVSVPSRREALINGWKQFEIDIAAFVPTEKKAQAIGAVPESLPVLFVEVEGQLTTSGNLAEFKAQSEILIKGIKTKLVNDQDFANAATTVTYLKDAEDRIELVKSQALKKTMSLEEVFSTLDGVKAKMRTARLLLNKQVTNDKTNRKNEIVQGAIDETNEYIVEVNKEFEEDGIQVIGIPTDMYAAVKGKSNFENMQSAVDDEVARFKIECMARSTSIRKALKTLAEMADGYMFLFSNTQSLVNMDPDHMKLLIKSTIEEYKIEAQAAEQKKIARRRAVIKSFTDYAEEADESASLEWLTKSRASVESESTENFEELKEEADNEKAAVLAIFDKLIAKVNATIATIATRNNTATQATPEVAGTSPVQTSNHVQASTPNVAPLRSVSLDPFEMKEAILTVLEGAIFDTNGNRDNEGLDAAITFGNSPTLEAAQKWAAILRASL